MTIDLIHQLAVETRQRDEIADLKRALRLADAALHGIRDGAAEPQVLASDAIAALARIARGASKKS
jgi:hypothetical protein